MQEQWKFARQSNAMFSQINVAQFNFEELTGESLSDYLVCLTVFILRDPVLLLAQRIHENHKRTNASEEQNWSSKPPGER